MDRSTIISTMLIPQSDGHTTRPLAEYFSHFEHLVATGLPIVAYVAPALAGQVRGPNVTVVPTTLKDLPLWRETQGMEIRLPAIRNLSKDTADYLVLVNSKTELMRRTIARTDPDATHAFVDFGIFHVIRDRRQAQNRLRALAATYAEVVTLPGISRDVSDELDRVNWRFCGGFFYGPADAMLTFAELHQQRARALLPMLSWEVNIWASMERHRELACQWYQAGHDDSIFDYPVICPPWQPGRA